MQARNQSESSNFYYTKKMAATLNCLPMMCTFVGLTGMSFGGCGIGHSISTGARIPLVLLGLTGLLVTSTASLAGSVITVPVDIAIDTKRYCDHYNKAAFFKAANGEPTTSQLPIPETSISQNMV